MRDMRDLTGLRIEGAWIGGCVAAAVGWCYLAPDYGYSPVLFLSVMFYVITGLLRLLCKFLGNLVRLK